MADVSWKITDKEIVTLWTEIWPKVVALAWLNPEIKFAAGKIEEDKGRTSISYREAFILSMSFRVYAVKEIAKQIDGIEYTSDIPIRIANPTQLGMDISSSVESEELNKFNELPPQESLHPDCWQQIVDIAKSKKLESVVEWAKAGLARWDEREEEPEIEARPIICQGSLYGETFFTIAEDGSGIIMPWPNMDPKNPNTGPQGPSMAQILTGYSQGGGLLPKANTQQTKLFNDLTNFEAPTNLDKDKSDTFAGLSGVSLLTLFEKWPRTIAQAWEEEYLYTTSRTQNDIKGKLAKHIMPEVWSVWPSYVKGEVNSDKAQTNFVLEYRAPGNTAAPILLSVPLPEMPNQTTILQELVVGQASNPLYSNSYS